MSYNEKKFREYDDNKSSSYKRDRSPVKDKYREKDRERSRSRERDRNRRDYRDISKERRDKDKYRDRSKERDRSRERKDKDRSRSRSKEKRKNRDRSRSRSKEKKKSYKRDRKYYSSDESDSDYSSYSSGDESDRERRERRKRKKEEKRLKQLKKESETPEEKRQRRLEKKLRKDANRSTTSSSSTSSSSKSNSLDLTGYSNDMNPFNDTNLQEKFVWKAKRDKLIKEGMRPEEYDQKYGKKRKEDIQEELEKARKKREQREKEQQIWEEEKERLQRMRDMSNNEELEKKEEEFHYLQACKRCETRLFDNRPKPIDFLYKTLNMLHLPEHRDNREPVQMIQSIQDVSMLEELVESIRDFTYLDTDPENLEFWEAALQLSQYQLSFRRGDTENDNETTALHHSLTNDIKSILQGKSFKELVELENEIVKKLESGSAMNVEYWETLLKHLKIYKSSAYLREKFISNLKQRLSDIETEKYLSDIQNKSQLPFEKYNEEDGGNDNDGKDDEKEGNAKKEVGSGEKDPFDEENEFDEKFDLEVALETKYYSWHDKYRPRKPKFFNRVHTGYDWTKYNRTHYDKDNPPPKVVRGYKFNIFYPDLIDSSKSPQYFVTPSPDNPDTCILRFHAGPPYEDIAFKIVKKEWEKSHKYGFKCVFEKGVLHLWFNFKRYRYRR